VNTGGRRIAERRRQQSLPGSLHPVEDDTVTTIRHSTANRYQEDMTRNGWLGQIILYLRSRDYSPSVINCACVAF